MAIVHYRSDGVTPLGGLAITGFNAGADSDTITFRAKNEGVATALNYMALQRTVHPTIPTVRLASGAPPQDQMWGRIRIVGYDNSVDPTWSVGNTDWYFVGAYGGGPPVPTIPVGCTVIQEYRAHPPGEAEVAPWVIALVPLYDEYHQPAPAALSRAMRGILHGVGDFTRNGIVRGLEVTATGTPDDEIHSAAGIWLHRGILYGDIARDHTLNQNDGAAAALASGQSYWAVVSRGAGTVTVTKGTKAVSPTKPTQPAGDLVVRYAKVDYQAGASVVEEADLDGTTLYDRYLAVDLGSLTLGLHPGQALGGGTWRFSGGILEVALEDDADNYVWQLATGLPAVTTDAAPPELTALGPWWKVTTASGVITDIVDLRTYAGGAVEVRLGGELPGSPGDIDETVIGEDRLAIERVMVLQSDNGGGSSGLTKYEVKINGTTIYTDSGIDDQRPAFAFDAADLLDQGGVHQVTDLYRGDVVTFASVTHPTGGTPTSAKCVLVCRRP